MVLGSLTGSFCGGVQCGKFGRKKSLMIDSFIFIIGTLFVALSPNFYLILMGITIKHHLDSCMQFTQSNCFCHTFQIQNEISESPSWSQIS